MICFYWESHAHFLNINQAAGELAAAAEMTQRMEDYKALERSGAEVRWEGVLDNNGSDLCACCKRLCVHLSGQGCTCKRYLRVAIVFGFEATQIYTSSQYCWLCLCRKRMQT